MSNSPQKLYLDRLKELILTYAANYPVKVILFGSHAKGTAHRYSDVDVAIYSEQLLPGGFISELKELIEESHIPYHVDLIDLAATDNLFRQKVLQEGIEWKD